MTTLLDSLNVSASGLAAQRTRLNATASNIANVNTTRTEEGGPYRRQDPVFRSYMEARGVAGVEVAEIQEDQADPRLVFDPGHPDADQAGYVAMPNINLVEEMVNMISSQRGYDANATSIDTARKMARSAIELATS